MAISPVLLFWLLVCSFLFGVAMGVMNDLFRISRVLLGVRYVGKRLDCLYERPLPILKRPLRTATESKVAHRVLPILIFAQDVFLLCSAGVGTVILNYYFNHGKFRLYTVVALLVGFVLYYFTVGKLVTAVSEIIVFGVRALVSILMFLIFRPFVTFFDFLEKYIKKISKNIKKTIANKRKRVYTISKEAILRKRAKIGFLPIAPNKAKANHDTEAP